MKKPLKILVAGLVIATTLIAGGLLFYNQPQCPENVTIEQIDSGDCIVGANIGLGMIVLLGATIAVGSIIASLISYSSSRKQA